MSIINFLLTGDDVNSIIPEISAKEREVRKVKREAVIEYIYNKKDYLKKQKESLEASLNQEDEENLDARIEDTVFQIASIEQKIQKLTDRSSKLVSEIYTISLKLEEASFLQERYKTLRSQYNADLK